jgi:hypothetical protein
MMMTTVKSWFQENHSLVLFLAAQLIAVVATCISILVYAVKLEARVNALEIRGSPHLAVIDNRLTGLENQTRSNAERIDRVVSGLTRDLGK